MSLIKQFETDLRALTGGGGALCVADSGKRLKCDLVEVQPLACKFERLVLEADSLAGASMDRLKEISDDVAARLTYLLEPVGVVELDHAKCVVQMRSNPPQKDDDGTQYYELFVRKGGSISLCRYQAQSGAPRQRVPAILTQEVLVRLAGDFDAAVD